MKSLADSVSTPSFEQLRAEWEEELSLRRSPELGNKRKSYQVKGTLSPEDKDIGIFDFPDGVLPLRPSRGHHSSPELVHTIRDYLERKEKHKYWEIIGVLPKPGAIEDRLDESKPAENCERARESNSNEGTTKAQELTSTEESKSADAVVQSLTFNHKISSLFKWSHRPTHAVLIEQTYRCNCEESWRPEHYLEVNFKPGYTPVLRRER